MFEFNRGAATMNTTYESASSSKWITATIILSFIETSENKNSAKPLTLASRPQDFIAGWPFPANHPMYAMTLRDLMSFNSGLTEEAGCLNRPDPNFEDCVLVMASANLANSFVPGQYYYYSGVHLQVAGLMAMKARSIAHGVTQSTWQNIFSDFQARTGLLKNSQYDLPSAGNPRLAGGMHWTGNDYVEFLRQYARGNVLSANFRQQQLSDQVGSAVIGASPAERGTNEEWHYGLGLWAECHAEVFNCQNSIEVFSSAGAYGAYPFFNVKHGYYGLLSRQGGLGTGFLGYNTYAAVAEPMKKWATKICR